MNTFMGPMTPPPASPGQPQKLDIRTNPNQRAGFKQFMRQRTAPIMPIQQMPQAQPMPMPMMQPRPQMPLRMEMGGEVDIFDPQNYHEGGLVNTLGQLSNMSGQMVDALNTMIMGGGQGGGATSGFNSGSGFTNTPSVSPTTPSFPPPRPVSPEMPQRGQDFFGMLGPSGNAPADNPNTPQNEYQDFLDSGVSDTGNPFTTGGPFGDNFNIGPIVEPLRETFGMKDGGAVPPRNTNIGGQPHMLSYITPDEADILEALGGSGEAGPMGIPAFYDEGIDEGDQAASATGEQGDPSAPGFDDPGGDDKQQQRYEEDAQRRRDEAKAALEASIAAENAREAELARQRSRALDQARRAQDRVQAGLAREDLATSLGVTTPETTISATSAPGLSESTIAAVGETDPDDDTDAGGIETTDLLGVDDLLSLDPVVRDESKFSTVAGQTAVSPVTAPATAAEKAQAAADATVAGIGMPDEYDPVTTTDAQGKTTTVTFDEGETPDYTKDRQGYRDGLPTSIIDGKVVGFFDDPANFVTTPTGTKVTSRLGGLTAAQRAAMPGFMNPKESEGFTADVMNTLGINPMEDPLGYEIDPTTGRVTGVVNEPSLQGMGGAALDILTDIFFDDPSTFTSDRQLFTDSPTVYTGFGEGSRPKDDLGSGGPDPVKQPFDPCPDGFFLKDGVCTPIQQADTGDGTPNQIGGGPNQPPPVPGGPVVVPSPRPTVPFNLQGPVGYGVPTVGQAAPSVATNAALYQQMLNQQAAAPIRLQSGGPVSSNLDRAADNFLKSLMPTA